MNRPVTLTEFIDQAMTRARMDAKDIERETGVRADWTRQLKAGRFKQRPDQENVRKVARALGVDEADIWQYLGRYDMVAALRSAPADPQPVAGDLGLIDALTQMLVATTQALTDVRTELREAKDEASRERHATAELIGHLSDQLDEIRDLVRTQAASAAQESR